jgi:hypothetical protein
VCVTLFKAELFMWFGPSERNTQHLQEKECCIAVCVAMFKAELNLHRIEVV